MTKSEVGKEYWFKGKVTQVDEGDSQPYKVLFGDECFSDYIWIPESVEIAEAIPEREKVTIPKEVADWIVEHKNIRNNRYNYKLSAVLHNGLNIGPKKVKDWLLSRQNQDTFARAWLDGYEIEKEPLYYVKIPNVYHGDLGYNENFDNYSFYNKNHDIRVRFELTEKEIKQNHEWAWQFAVPVEEER